MVHRSPAGNSFNAFESPAQAVEADLTRQDADDRALLNEKKNITASEADWVIAHLTRDGALSSAEQRLLQLLDAQALSIAPPLRALVDNANTAAITAAVSSPRP
jgi:hypothetical protein